MYVLLDKEIAYLCTLNRISDMMGRTSWSKKMSLEASMKTSVFTVRLTKTPASPTIGTSSSTTNLLQMIPMSRQKLIRSHLRVAWRLSSIKRWTLISTCPSWVLVTIHTSQRMLPNQVESWRKKRRPNKVRTISRSMLLHMMTGIKELRLPDSNPGKQHHSPGTSWRSTLTLNIHKRFRLTRGKISLRWTCQMLLMLEYSRVNLENHLISNPSHKRSPSSYRRLQAIAMKHSRG